jgi:alpha-ribazole phosphatase
VEVALIRHTACAIEAGICYGQLDVPLASSAAADIDRVLAKTPRVDAVYTSPALRCVVLAMRLAARDRRTPILREGLRELCFGRWEGTRWDDISRMEIDKWSANTWEHAPPGGETEESLWTRVERVYQELLGCRRRSIAVIAHGGSLRVLRCLLAQRHRESRWEWSPKHGDVQVLRPARPSPSTQRT